jgi:peroxiredoxin Q/BCP
MTSEELRMLQEGDPAPDFTTVADDGTPVSLAGLRGTTVILYFYPKDDTTDCTEQACGFRDAWRTIRRRGATVLGVSRNDAKTHRKFRAKHALPFPLLVDDDHAIAEAYGVWVEKSMYGKKYFGIARTTFVIDAGGIIRHVFRKVQVTGHAQAVLATLAS